MRNPKQAATDKALRELLGLVTKPLVAGLKVEKETPSSAAKQDLQPDKSADEDGDDGIDINQIMGAKKASKDDDDGFKEHPSGNRAMSLTDLASQSIPATRKKSPRSKRGKKRGRR